MQPITQPIVLTYFSTFLKFCAVCAIGALAGYIGHMARNSWQRFKRRSYLDNHGSKVIVAGIGADAGIGAIFAGLSWVLYSLPALASAGESSIVIIAGSVVGAGLIGLSGRASKVENPKKD